MATAHALAGQRKKKLALSTLIIDPEPTSRIRLKDTLRGIEFVESVVEQSTTHQLHELAKSSPLHVVMIDQELGEQELFDIVRSCRELPAFSQTQFVLVAGNINKEIVEQAKEVGIRGILQRPFDQASLEKVLTGAISKPAAPKTKKLGGDAVKDTFTRIRQISIFSGYNDMELVKLLKICKTRIYPAGANVFKEGDRGESLFVLVSGEVEIQKEIDGERRTLVSMGPGDCFGEMAIIDDEPRMADAVAVSPCTVIEVSESVVNTNDDVIALKLVRQLAILLVKKLRKSSG